MNENALFKISYGLFILTARDGEKDNGCIINTAIQAASLPNRLSVCVSKTNLTHDMIMNTDEFNVSVISQKVDFELFKHFGFVSGREADKFDSFSDCKRGKNGIYYVTEATNAYISVKTDTTVDLGSHTMFIGKITDSDILSDIPSATYEYYFENIKPKAENTASNGKTVWRCKICGYEYEGESLPEDFICPLCKHPASDFEKIS